MKKLLVLVGVRGAGKTTVVESFKGGRVLKPSTTRKKRFDAESEYHFEESWNPEEFAWTITFGGNNYGMRWSELREIPNLGLTVFEPSSLQTLHGSNVNKEFEVITIGIDTISSLADQHARVGEDVNRRMDQASFDKQLAIVRSCDVVLAGPASVILDAVEELAAIIGGRGGVLSAKSIAVLMRAGTLLDKSDSSNIESASYDLRIADQYWCQGKYHTLTADNPIATIPPYSFALVQAQELARLPRFVVASFDIRVSLFFSGVVLSNGPQVDPGYSGALFCMLHNASGTEIGINRGSHFATIQFQTTATNSAGYDSQYQNKKGFSDFLDGSSAKKPGGQIYEKFTELSEKLNKDHADFKKDLRTETLAVAAVLAGIVAVGTAVGVWVVDKANTSMEATMTRAKEATEKSQQQIEEALQKLNSLTKQASESRPTRQRP